MILTSNNQFKTRLGNLEQRIGSNTLISGSSVITEDNVDTECFIPFVNNAPSGTPQPLRGDTSLKYNANANILTCPTVSGNLLGNATTAGATTTGLDGGGGTRYLSFKNGTTGLLQDFVNTGLNYTPNVNTLYCTTFSGALIGNATTAGATTTGLDGGGGTRYLSFKNGTTGLLQDFVNTGLNYTPNINTLYCTTFSGALIGNATTAGATTTILDNGGGTKYVSFKTGTTGLLEDSVNASLTYTPNITTLYCPTFSGALIGNATSATNAVISAENADTTCFIPFVNNAPSGTAQPLKGNNSLTYNAQVNSLTVSGSNGITVVNSGFTGITINTANPASQAILQVNGGGIPYTHFLMGAQTRQIAMYANPQGTDYTVSGSKYTESSSGICYSGVLVFNDGINERARFNNSGFLGIGTSTPSEKLNVVGGLVPLKIEPTTGGTDGVSLTLGYSGIKFNSTAPSYKTFSIQNELNDPNATISLLQNTTSGPKGITIKNDGNVGINTTNPVYKLQVEGSGTANEIVGWFNNQGAFSSSIAVRQSSKTAYITNHYGLGTPNYDGQISNAISFGVSSGSSPIQFYNGNTGVGSRGTAKMTILENGRTGIGTNAPALTLDVAGGSVGNSTGDLTLNVNSVGVGGALKVVGGTGVLSGTAGGTSGQHLVITINGVVYKIKLENA